MSTANPSTSPSAYPAYQPRRTAQSDFFSVRGLRYHVNRWGDAGLVSSTRPPLVLLHGWMDVGASFQFVVDALAAADGFERLVFAPDWRGFGRTQASGADSYWFPDYLGDLDGLLEQLAPGVRVDLLGHSMGGNVVMSYAGLRPDGIRRLVNLEGFGLPPTEPAQAPARLRKWLAELKTPAQLRSYENLAAVAQRLQQNNARLSADRAAWLAPHWSREGDDGRWHILGDAAHKRVNPVLYQREEVLQTWKLIEAPLLWVEGAFTDISRDWGGRYTREDFDSRLAQVPNTRRVQLPGCGHMLHHEQPEALARELAAFFAEAG